MPASFTTTYTNKQRKESQATSIILPTNNSKVPGTTFLDTCIGLISRVDSAANYHWKVAKHRLRETEHSSDDDGSVDSEAPSSVDTDEMIDGDVLRFQFHMQWRQLREDVCTILRQHYSGRQQLVAVELALRKLEDGATPQEHTEEELLTARGKMKNHLDRTHPARVLTLLTKMGLFSHYSVADGKDFLSEDLSARFRELELAEPVIAH